MFDETLEKILKDIAQEHELNEEELLKKYITDEHFPFPVSKQRPKITKATTGGTKTGTRKKKNAENETDMYIELEQIQIDGEYYLLDSSKTGGNKIYTYDENHPKFIGILLANGAIKRNEQNASS